MTEREPSARAYEKATELHDAECPCRASEKPEPDCLRIMRDFALALDDFAAQRERAGLEKALAALQSTWDAKQAAAAIRALMVEPSEKETGR